nr:MAG TPA: hypothetical protein [Caudoviricetes sp.]
MTKNLLKQYRMLKLEFDDINATTCSKTVKDSVQGSMKNHPYIKGIRHIEGVADESLLYKKSDLKAQLKAVEDFVKSIEDSKVRKAIEIYYIDDLDESCEKPTWENVADKFKDGSTGDSIKKTVSRYLKKYL